MLLDGALVAGWFVARQGQFFWTFKPSPGPTQPPINAHRKFFFLKMKSARGASMISDIQLVQSLRVSYVIPPLHHMPSWNEQRQLLTTEIFLCSKSLVTVINKSGTHEASCVLTLWCRNFLLNFKILCIKMWILQDPKSIALWNKRHLEEKKKTENVQHV